jgi:hypothetical protein
LQRGFHRSDRQAGLIQTQHAAHMQAESGFSRTTIDRKLRQLWLRACLPLRLSVEPTPSVPLLAWCLQQRSLLSLHPRARASRSQLSSSEVGLLSAIDIAYPLALCGPPVLPSLGLNSSRHRQRIAVDDQPVPLASALTALRALREAGAPAMVAWRGEFFGHVPWSPPNRYAMSGRGLIQR